MEALLIILLFIPAVGRLVELLGLGVRKENEIFLPGVTVSALRPLLVHFSRTERWKLLQEDQNDDRSFYIFRKGQWGSSIKGVQQITVTFFPKPDGVKIFINSKSRLGQVYDFNENQKNLESFGLFFTDILKHDDLIKRIKESDDKFLTPKILVNPKYWLVLIILLLLVIAVKQIVYLSKEKIPGFVTIRFHKGVTQELSDELLVEFGTVHCVGTPEEEGDLYECEVPIGMEEEISQNAAKSNQVKEASPKFRK